MVISILTCVQVLPKLNSNFLCFKKARFLDDKSNTCCLLFFNSASFDIFLAKVWIFFCFFVVKLLLKVCFFLSSKSLLWGKCNFRFFLIFESCQRRREKYAQRLFKEKKSCSFRRERILIEFSAKQTFIHIKEFFITKKVLHKESWDIPGFLSTQRPLT